MTPGQIEHCLLSQLFDVVGPGTAPENQLIFGADDLEMLDLATELTLKETPD